MVFVEAFLFNFCHFHKEFLLSGLLDAIQSAIGLFSLSLGICQSGKVDNFSMFCALSHSLEIYCKLFTCTGANSQIHTHTQPLLLAYSCLFIHSQSHSLTHIMPEIRIQRFKVSLTPLYIDSVDDRQELDDVKVTDGCMIHQLILKKLTY